MGNRGVLHNSNKDLKCHFKTKEWIICLLEFKGRKRELMSPNAYTELFFLDEVTALAVGHRLCAECSRSRYNEFRKAWMEGNQWEKRSAISAPEMDEVLHRERIECDNKVTCSGRLLDLPHGTMYEIDQKSYVISMAKFWNGALTGIAQQIRRHFLRLLMS